MPSRILKTPGDRAAWVRFLESQEVPLTVSAVKGAKRSNPQNATLHKWFSQIADEYGDTTAAIKAECKLRFGLPIMEAERPEWVAEWQPLYSPLPYRAQIKLFECIPMTSKMTVKQMSAFMEAVQKEYRAQGIDLIDPEARKYEQEFGR
jgi:hypothetical protein